MDSNWQKDESEDDDISDYKHGLAGNEIWEELLCERVELVAGTDADEAGEENVDHGIVGYEDQDAVSVCTEEDVVLRYHHLNVQTTYPGKEAGVS